MKITYNKSSLYNVCFKNNGMITDLKTILHYNRCARKINKEMIEQLNFRGYCMVSVKSKTVEYLVDVEFMSKITMGIEYYGIYGSLYEACEIIVREHKINKIFI